jgi:hypothetical protein
VIPLTAKPDGNATAVPIAVAKGSSGSSSSPDALAAPLALPTTSPVPRVTDRQRPVATEAAALADADAGALGEASGAFFDRQAVPATRTASAHARSALREVPDRTGNTGPSYSCPARLASL